MKELADSVVGPCTLAIGILSCPMALLIIVCLPSESVTVGIEKKEFFGLLRWTQHIFSFMSGIICLATPFGCQVLIFSFDEKLNLLVTWEH